ncbi:NUDIX domain-containing protein [uncultured Ruminobacter sp.]|jgi:phosphatase NudJ|uniref:NUDIX domain-containing protein n=1 Tax=Ruminobacter sp. TaxID=2774296 RepID=UPI00262D377F|nr:NUDIX domain-containing protein [uncultured Ruminobacter sp.]
MSYKFKPVSVVAVIVTVGDKYLIVEERLGNGLPVFNTPSGHLEHWENLVQGARRELFEETGIRTEHLDGIVGIYNLVQDNYTMLRTVFSLRLESIPELKINDPDGDIVAHHWLTFEECQRIKDSMRSELVFDAIRDFRDGRHYPLELITSYSRLSGSVRSLVGENS